jgi:catechol 2,3-dioxygenase-like lactoylglutathione lyase family enzyme
VPSRWSGTVQAFLLVALIPALSHLVTAQDPATIGLDHIPVAVRDLERASATYRALGFALKQGRDHASGIRNVHVKFPDGAGIELLTAAKAVDALTVHYVDRLRAGEGPAFLSFHARDTGRFHAALREGGYEFRQDGEITELHAPELEYVFVVRDNRSPADRPEHFAHANGATALSAVWIATENGDALARFLVHLGGRQQRRQVLAPEPVQATVVTLGEGEVFIVPRSHQVLAGRPVIGATFRVSDLNKVQRTLEQAHMKPWAGAGTEDRVVVEPSVAHGLWLEFRPGS